MVQLLDLLLLVLTAALAFTSTRPFFASWAIKVNCFKAPLAGSFAIILTIAGCLLVTAILHEPIPRTHDEFSYVLMGDTFSHGRVSNPSLPLPEFFDTFHVLMRPVYVSKYFPVQGLFLALGQKLTRHPAVGLWLSSALACAATVWMLQAWIEPGWGLLGGFLMIAQYGVFSYWSQAYWGGMAAALGGALFFGAMRRLWEGFEWQNAFWLALGLIILANSRPLEGVLAALPATGLFLHQLWRKRRWREAGFWRNLVFPCFIVLMLGAVATGAYNRAITGSALKTPYMLHERQYQESPPLLFLPLRPKLTYSSPVLQYYYEIDEMRPYVTQRVPKYFVTGIAHKLLIWWAFYCGILLSVPLGLPALLRKGRIRAMQIAILAGLIGLPSFSSPTAVIIRGLIDLLVLGQLAVLWIVFDDVWSRLSIATCSLILLELFFAKWAFPHYFAPAACLVLYLQVEGLRRVWNRNPQAEQTQGLSRSERRRMARDNQQKWNPTFNSRGLVYWLPVACLLSLVMRVEARLQGWGLDPFGGPDRQALLMNDWSLRRADLDHWMEQQPNSQLVFVRYSQRHNVNFEWVYNHADIMHSHVIWARDLGPEHNKLLLQLLPDRTAWLLEADRREPQLIPYEQANNSDAPSPPTNRPISPEQPE